MKPTSTIARLLCAALLAAPRAVSAQSPPVKSTPTEEGRSHFDNAVGLYREGDYRGALIEFRRAYEVSHNYRALYNIGQTELELQDYAAARSSFQRYLAQGGAEIDPERRAAIEVEIKKLNARVARIEIKTNVAGADILVDDTVVGQTPLAEPIVVSAGRRRITVQKGDLLPSTTLIDVAGGDVSTVTMNLIAAKPPGAAGEPAGPLAPPQPSHTALWVSLAATTALTAGAAATGVLALQAHTDAEAKLATLGVTSASVEAAHTKTNTLAVTTDVLTGAAIGMGLVTIILGATGGKSRTERKPAATLHLGPRGAMVLGRF